MTLDFTLTPDYSLDLSRDGHPLGNLRFGVHWQGATPFEEVTLQQDRTRMTEEGLSLTLALGLPLVMEIQIDCRGDDFLALQFTLFNRSAAPLIIDRLALPELTLDPAVFDSSRPIWTMQGAAVGWGQDFAFPLNFPYERENYLGHLQDAEGGGIPVNYFWTPGLGLSLMHVEPKPQEWYMPVRADADGIRTALEYRQNIRLEPGQQYHSPKVVVSIHHGDFFEPLSLYRRLISAAGSAPAEPTADCFEPAWCSWGYEFDIKASEMLGVIPALQPLNIKWMTLDDRWFDAYGDWNPRSDTFPGGGHEMREMNDRIHAAGGKNQIWWYPLCAEDSHGEWESHVYGQSQLLRDHPDWVVKHADGSVARNNRHLAMLCPAVPEVREHIRRLTERFIGEWDFDGHKLDNIYTMPACHNPLHHHACPEESVEAFAEAYRIIFETTRHLKPDSVTQICPCGTPLTHSLMPYTDQTVTADPTSSEQIRQRIKFYKALMGPRAAVFADHVELSDNCSDFASEIGTGGVPATKFVYPEDELLMARLKEYWSFPPEKQAEWKKWFDLYNLHRPAEGEYLNLYDIGFEHPEAHVIRKGDALYYGFYAENYLGSIELRGLSQGTYSVEDYVHGTRLGVVSAEKPNLMVHFNGSLLLKATPDNPASQSTGKPETSH